MIKYLDGMHETPDYIANSHLVLYKNDVTECYPPHWHFPIEFLMPVENDYTIRVNGTEYVVHPYEILYVSSGVIHETIAPPTGVRYFFQIDTSRIKSITGITNIFSMMGPCALFSPETTPEIHGQLVSIFEEICEDYFLSEEFFIPSSMKPQQIDEANKRSLCEAFIYGKLLSMLTIIGRNYLDRLEADSGSDEKRKEYLTKFMGITRYIDEHFAEDLNLDDMAALAGFSKFHFSRLFKQFTNLSFYKYVNQQRILHAEQLLADPDISVTQVAIQSGFSSSSAFIRMFKQVKNCTPTDFRNIFEKKSFDYMNEIPKTISQEKSQRNN